MVTQFELESRLHFHLIRFASSSTETLPYFSNSNSNSPPHNLTDSRPSSAATHQRGHRRHGQTIPVCSSLRGLLQQSSLKPRQSTPGNGPSPQLSIQYYRSSQQARDNESQRSSHKLSTVTNSKSVIKPGKKAPSSQPETYKRRNQEPDDDSYDEFHESESDAEEQPVNPKPAAKQTVQHRTGRASSKASQADKMEIDAEQTQTPAVTTKKHTKQKMTLKGNDGC
jgi:hypothetical protein